jgi:hypothetical protein
VIFTLIMFGRKATYEVILEAKAKAVPLHATEQIGGEEV